jgi:hypothetical protein
VVTQVETLYTPQEIALLLYLFGILIAAGKLLRDALKVD